MSLYQVLFSTEVHSQKWDILLIIQVKVQEKNWNLKLGKWGKAFINGAGNWEMRCVICFSLNANVLFVFNKVKQMLLPVKKKKSILCRFLNSSPRHIEMNYSDHCSLWIKCIDCLPERS